MFDAVLFDMDGVLVDSEPLHARAWDRVLQDLGRGKGEDWFIHTIGKTDRWTAEMLVADEEIPGTPEELLASKQKHYAYLIETEMTPIPGVREALDRLYPRRMAIATSTRRADAETTLRRIGLRDYFEILITHDECARHKPDPEPYRKAAQGLGVPPRECVVLEDSPFGMEAGKGAGCAVLGIRVPFGHNDFTHADQVFDTTVAAIDWILQQG